MTPYGTDRSLLTPVGQDGPRGCGGAARGACRRPVRQLRRLRPPGGRGDRYAVPGSRLRRREPAVLRGTAHPVRSGRPLPGPRGREPQRPPSGPEPRSLPVRTGTPQGPGAGGRLYLPTVRGRSGGRQHRPPLPPRRPDHRPYGHGVRYGPRRGRRVAPGAGPDATPSGCRSGRPSYRSSAVRRRATDRAGGGSVVTAARASAPPARGSAASPG